jgi:hypothetical protein
MDFQGAADGRVGTALRWPARSRGGTPGQGSPPPRRHQTAVTVGMPGISKWVGQRTQSGG